MVMKAILKMNGVGGIFKWDSLIRGWPNQNNFLNQTFIKLKLICKIYSKIVYKIYINLKIIVFWKRERKEENESI